MNKERITINLEQFAEILNDEFLNFKLIDSRYKFHDQDHDLWRFEAIVQRIFDKTFFSVMWEDSYHGLYTHFDKDDTWELVEVVPKEVKTIIYE